MRRPHGGLDLREPGDRPRPRIRGPVRQVPGPHVRQGRHRHDQRRARTHGPRGPGGGGRLPSRGVALPPVRGHLRPAPPLRRERGRGGEPHRVRQLPRRHQGRTRDRRAREGPVGEAPAPEPGGHQVRAQPRDRQAGTAHDPPPGGVQEPPGRRPGGHPLRRGQAGHRPALHRRPLQQVQPRDSPDHMAMQGVPRQGMSPLPRQGQDVRYLRAGDHRRHRPGDGRREGALLPRHGPRGHRRAHARRREALRPGDLPAQEEVHRPGRAREEVQRRRYGRVQLPALRPARGRREVQGRRVGQGLSRAR